MQQNFASYTPENQQPIAKKTGILCEEENKFMGSNLSIIITSRNGFSIYIPACQYVWIKLHNNYTLPKTKMKSS